ncbi:MAG: N-acetylmuramoyl-L-alanine amidase [bacterium]
MRRIMLFFSSISFLMTMGYTLENKVNKIIYIDPGHGGYDGGAVVNEIEEADINLEISLQLKSILEDNGYTVLLTRETDEDLCEDKFIKKEDIKKRVELINNSDCLLYISIHQNLYTDSKYSGAQCFYNKYNPLSNMLANNVQSSIIKQLNNTTRVAKSIEEIYLIDNVIKPGILIECGFMSNEHELSLLMTDEYQKKFCNSIYYGILSYLLLV